MFTTVMLVAGLPCVAFEKTLHANHDAISREGILEMITLMCRCDPDALILVGPPSIGRHELRQRLLDDTVKFAVPVPRKSAQT